MSGFVCVQHEAGHLCRGKYREDGVFTNCNVVFQTAAEVPVNVDKTDSPGTRHWYGDNNERIQLFAEFLKLNNIPMTSVVVVDGIER